MFYKIRNNKGFTLIELMVVVLIIGGIAALITPSIAKKADDAKEKLALAELKSMKTIIDMYYVENGQYPAASNKDAEGNIGNVLQEDGVNWTGDETGIKDSWENAYKYAVVDEKYVIYTNGPPNTGETEENAIAATDKQSPRDGQSITEDSGVLYGGISYGTPVSSFVESPS
ncbi:MAG: type II secretion system protein GspG [Clostridiales bacterium]|nr:type II secretion system protein GspG [Clostridiales bacterium]MCF8021151.1 type II secretion system protein GspG [Clostridiales bacterium]